MTTADALARLQFTQRWILRTLPYADGTITSPDMLHLVSLLSETTIVSQTGILGNGLLLEIGYFNETLEVGGALARNLEVAGALTVEVTPA